MRSLKERCVWTAPSFVGRSLCFLSHRKWVLRVTREINSVFLLLSFQIVRTANQRPRRTFREKNHKDVPRNLHLEELVNMAAV